MTQIASKVYTFTEYGFTSWNLWERWYVMRLKITSQTRCHGDRSVSHCLCVESRCWVGWFRLELTNEITFCIHTKLCQNDVDRVRVAPCGFRSLVEKHEHSQGWNAPYLLCCDPGHNALRKKLTGVATIVAMCFKKVKSGSWDKSKLEWASPGMN